MRRSTGSDSASGAAQLAWAAAAPLGLAWARLQPERRALALANLRRSLPGLDADVAERIVRRMFRHLAALPLEVLLADPPGGQSRQGRPIDLGPAGVLHVVGRRHLDVALTAGRGALLLSAHLGNFELALLGEAAAGLALSVLTKRLSPPWLDRLWQRRREGLGVEVLPDDHSLSRVMWALGQGRCVAMTLDQHANRQHAVPVQFFGREASAHRSMALLSARARAPVVPALARRRRPGVHELRYLPPIPFERRGMGVREAIAHHTQHYTDVIEAAVCTWPDQWTWLHRRWKLDAVP